MHLFLQTNLGLKKSKRKKQYCANPTARRGLLMAGSAGRLTDRYRHCTGKALSLLMWRSACADGLAHRLANFDRTFRSSTEMKLSITHLVRVDGDA